LIAKAGYVPSAAPPSLLFFFFIGLSNEDQHLIFFHLRRGGNVTGRPPGRLNFFSADLTPRLFLVEVTLPQENALPCP